MTELDLLSPLRPLCDPDLGEIVLRALPDAKIRDGAQAVAGHLGDLRFVVIVAADGFVTASLSHPRGVPTKAHVSAFWRRWGVEPEQTEPAAIFGGKRLLFIVRRAGRMH